MIGNIDIDSLGTSPEEKKRLQEGNLLPPGGLVLEIDKVTVRAIGGELIEKDAQKNETGKMHVEEESGRYLAVVVDFRVDTNNTNPDTLNGEMAGRSTYNSEWFRIFDWNKVDMSTLKPNLRRQHDMNMRSLIELVTASGVMVPETGDGTPNFVAAAASMGQSNLRVRAVAKDYEAADGRKFTNLGRYQAFDAISA